MITPLNLSPEELSAWRGLPLTKAFLAWLDESIITYQQAIPEYIVKNKLDEARAAAGAVKGYQEILWALMEEPPKPETEEEDEYIDPAARPSQREET